MDIGKISLLMGVPHLLNAISFSCIHRVPDIISKLWDTKQNFHSKVFPSQAIYFCWFPYKDLMCTFYESLKTLVLHLLGCSQSIFLSQFSGYCLVVIIKNFRWIPQSNFRHCYYYTETHEINSGVHSGNGVRFWRTCA